VRDPSFLPLAGSIVLGTSGAFLADDRVHASLPGDGWLAAGLTMFWIGVAIRVWSIRTLGRFFRFEVTVLSDHRVIDTGPYRYVRHPSYTGALLAFSGIGVALDNWLSVASLFFLPLIGFLWRIDVEEAALTARLGEEYRRYKRRTKRLIPGVW
jgi:protein-S-isoprenylcysteine O-methyltransferase Ste14